MIPEIATDDGLTLGGVPADRLVEEHGSPLFVLLEERLEETVERLGEAFDGWDLYYAAKANTLTRVLQVVDETGLGVEVMSDLELKLARRAGFDGRDVIFNGPAKTRAELEAALDLGARIHVDHLAEAERVVDLASGRPETPEVGVRVHPDLPEEVEREAYVTKASKLGVDPDLGVKVFRTLQEATDPTVLHIHVGTDRRDPKLHGAVAEFARDYVLRLQDEGVDVARVNLGGGLATRVDLEADLGAFCDAMQAPLQDLDVALELEPGRVLVGDAVVCLARVRTVKKTWGKTWVLLDAGANTLIPLRYTRYRVVSHRPPPDAPVDVGGPLCLPVDVVETSAKVQPEPGDVVAVVNAGAYTLTMEETFGYPRPAVAALRDGRAQVARRRETADDAVARDREVVW